MIPEGMMKDRVNRLAQKIYTEYRDKGELVILVIMNSAFRYFTDLVEALNRISENDFNTDTKL
jgi:hypoxanthine-guanine phosphoribosyltransferase